MGRPFLRVPFTNGSPLDVQPPRNQDLPPAFATPTTQRNPAIIRNAMLALALGCTAIALSACNTVRGVGQDLESVANAGEEAIN